MNIAVAVKVVPDDQDITVASDRSLDSSKAHQRASEYDLNAIEAAAQLAEAEGANLVTISASSGKAGADQKVRKDILSRGPEELVMISDDAFEYADARTTASALAKIAGDIEGGVDLIVTGDGSADMYAGQVDVQLAAIMGIPCINAVTGMKMDGDALVVERTLDDVVEEIEVPLPAVVAVQPDIALPRIPGMREILAAGKKPATVNDASGVETEGTITIESILAPEPADRKQEMIEEADAFADAVANVIR